MLPLYYGLEQPDDLVDPIRTLMCTSVFDMWAERRYQFPV